MRMEINLPKSGSVSVATVGDGRVAVCTEVLGDQACYGVTEEEFEEMVGFMARALTEVKKESQLAGHAEFVYDGPSC